MVIMVIAPPQCSGGGGYDGSNLVCFENSSIFPQLQALL